MPSYPSSLLLILEGGVLDNMARNMRFLAF